MVAYRITAAELKDLSEITITCAYCKKRITLQAESALIPEQCSSCNKVFDEKLRNALAAYMRFYRDGNATESKIEFLIRDKV